MTENSSHRAMKELKLKEKKQDNFKMPYSRKELKQLGMNVMQDDDGKPLKFKLDVIRNAVKEKT